MTNPEDPRTPQERAYDRTESSDPAERRTESSDPADAHSARPDQPTEHIPAHPTEQFYTADPTAAYGSAPNPTQAFPQYDPRFDPGAPPPNATRAYPTYTGNQYQTEAPFIENDSGHKPRRLALWVAGAAGVLLLVAVVLGGIALVSNSSAPESASSGTTSAPSPTTTSAPRTTTPSPSPGAPFDQLPGGLGEVIGAAGAAVGTISANDGSTLTLDAIGGSTVTVKITERTRIIGLDRATAADLVPGDTVVVQGSKLEDGAMTAELILSTTIPELGN